MLTSLPWKLLGVLCAVLAIVAAVIGYGHRQYNKGHEVATTEANTKIDRLKLDASAVLAAQVEKTRSAEKSLQDFINRQEKQDALYKKTVADLSDRLRLAAGPAGRLRDPNATPGCRLGSSGSASADTTASNISADNGSKADGLLSEELTRLLLDNAKSADEINAAFASCKSYALSVSKPGESQ